MPGWAWSLIGVGAGLVLLWIVLVATLWLARPDGLRPREMVRLLPDVLRLVRRLAADRTLPRGVRVRLWLLLGYLVSPIDLVPFTSITDVSRRVEIDSAVLEALATAGAFSSLNMPRRAALWAAGLAARTGPGQLDAGACQMVCVRGGASY